MRLLTSLTLAATALLLTNCHDVPNESFDDLVIRYDATGRYHTGPTIYASSPILIYTQNGVINNKAQVDRFLARRPWAAGYFSHTDVPVGNTTLTLTFRSANRATLTTTTPTSVDSIRTEITDRTPGALLLRQLDTARVMMPITTGCMTRVNQLAEAVLQARHDKTCQAMPPVTGYSQYCQVRRVRVLKARAKDLSIPLFSYLVQSGGCQTAYTGEWNMLSETLPSLLGTGDTVVVQEREIPLLR
ncbi:hypothetical protein [Hymenobacter jeollabukensis]|uniref:Uncharacterized protein n=1 Tax=Hymenobacter jeollabukensis TaxID=2025313 RepID=A0A5R8WRF2_9BACT|nr:hypothetical protein [Hymenobacter jeollabukensis]TLM93319.1 hypothetical protein FDY95_11920 [Hymenobacter jeollabukensis]